MIKRLLIFGLLLVLLLAGAALVGWQRYERFLSPYPSSPTAGGPGETDRDIELTIRSGTSARGILDQLETSGVIESATLARLYLVYRLGDPPLMAGDYRFNLPISAPNALDKIVRGDVVLETVTVIEGLTYMETADHLAAQGFGDLERFLTLMQSPELIRDLDPEATNLEGYLFPDTYSFARTATERDVVAAMVANFRTQASSLIAGKNARDIVTLASIVEKEATLDQERPLIAGVYAHRLRKRIGLYADPTIIYGKKLAGTWNGNLTRADLRTDSDYNTYMRPGLPPSPICSPGRASLAAAAKPPDVPYLYFVSRNDGSHVFAESLQEHNRNVNQWQRRYWQERRARNNDR